MKRLLIVVSLLLALIVAGKPETAFASSDSSSNFTQIKLINRGQTIHVSASIVASDNQLRENDTMSIAWRPVNQQVIAQGIKQVNDIFVGSKNAANKIGTYVVDADKVIIQFNKNAENYGNLTGKINFDIEVDNPTLVKQQVIFSAADNQKTVWIAPTDNDQTATVNGEVDSSGQNIAWQIKLNPGGQELKLNNTLPKGLEFDQDSLEILADGKPAELNKDTVEFTQAGIQLNLADIDAKTVIIKYNTKILDSEALTLPNQVALGCQSNEKAPAAVYQGWAVDQREPVFAGTYVAQQTTLRIDKEKAKERVSQAISGLFKLISDKYVHKAESDIQANESQSATAAAEPAQVKVSKAVEAVSDTNSDQEEKGSATASEDDNLENNTSKSKTDQEEKDDNDNSHSDQKLPQAGEAATCAISLAGVVILIAACAVFKIKLHK